MNADTPPPQGPIAPTGPIVFFVTSALGLSMAIYLGVAIGGGEVRSLLWIVAVAGLVLFALNLYRYVWQGALLLIFTNFIYRPVGFAIGATEISCALGMGAFGIYVWQRRVVKRPALLNEAGLPLVLRMLFIWLAYVSAHMLYNIKAPYRPSEFALNNALKSYFGVILPYFLLFYFAIAPTAIVVKRKFFWTVARLCLLGLVINLGLRLYEIAIGTTYFFVPGINAIDNLYTLRFVGPLAVLIGTVAVFAKDWRKRNGIQQACFLSLLALGAFGTLLSGGRASLLIVFCSSCAVLVLKRKMGVLMTFLAIGVVLVVVANMFSGWINKEANPFVQRSLQWVLLEKGAASEDTIESSTRWRRELARRTLAEWQSSPRIIWFGRATYGYGTADEIARDTEGGYEALLETALRRGATHNLITDFLIAYGLVGCILYLLLYLTIIRFLWKLRLQPSLAPATANLVLVCLISSGVNLFFGLIAGGNIPIEVIWCLIVLIAALHSSHGAQDSPVPMELAPPVDSKRIPAFAGRRA